MITCGGIAKSFYTHVLSTSSAKLYVLHANEVRRGARECLKLLIEHFWPAPLECESEKWALLEAVGRKISASGLAQGQVQRGAHSLTPAALSLSAFGAAAAKYLPHPPRALIVSAPIARCKIKKFAPCRNSRASVLTIKSRTRTNLFVCCK